MTYHVHKKISSAPGFDFFMGRIDSHIGFKKPCAIKFLKTKFQNDPRYLEFMFQEAKLNAPLQHRNIRQIIDVIELNGLYGLVMEYDVSVTLEEFLRELQLSKSKLPLLAALYICQEVASALEFAHKSTDPVTGENLQIIHCAVSPANILLTENGDVKLINFGNAFSKLRSGETELVSMASKFNYISPEQRYGVKLTASADNFALGVILWECIAGRPRFEDFEISLTGDNEDLNPEVPSLSEVAPDTAPELVEIVARATAINPDERYNSSGAFGRVIKSFLQRSSPGYGSDEFKVVIKRSMSSRFASSHKLIREALIAPLNQEQQAKVVRFDYQVNEGDKNHQLYLKGKTLTMSDSTAELNVSSPIASAMPNQHPAEINLEANIEGKINQNQKTHLDRSRNNQVARTNQPVQTRNLSQNPSNLTVAVTVLIGLIALCLMFYLKQKR